MLFFLVFCVAYAQLMCNSVAAEIDAQTVIINREL